MLNQPSLFPAGALQFPGSLLFSVLNRFADFTAMHGVISFFLVWVISAYLVLPCTPALLLFFLLFLASMAIALWGLALSTLFGKARPAAAVALLVHVLAYFAVYTIDQEDDRTRKKGGIAIGCALVLKLERRKKAVAWILEWCTLYHSMKHTS